MKNKIDITKVLLTQLCMLKNREVYGIPYSMFDCNVHLDFYELDKYIFVYPINNYWFDLSYSTMIPTINQVRNSGEEFFRPDDSVSLLEIIDIEKYKYNKKRYIKYNDLLYIIEPLIQRFNHCKEPDYFKSVNHEHLVVGSVCHNNNVFDNVVLKPFKYFLVDIDGGNVVSYNYIKNEIPYVSSKRLKPYKEKQYTKKRSIIK